MEEEFQNSKRRFAVLPVALRERAMKFGGGEESPVVRELEQTPIFSGLTKEQLRTIVAASKEREFQAGQKIVSEGETGRGFYLIVDGKVEVRHGDKVLSSLGRGQFFGEMALLEEQPRSADIVATEPTRCLVLVSWAFHGLVVADYKMARAVMKEMSRRIRLAN